MQKSFFNGYLAVGIALFYGSTVVNVKAASVTQSLGQRTPEQILIAQSASSTSAAVEKDDFRFQSVGCQRKGAEVICSALITNLADSDRVIGAVVKYYNPISRIIDTSGDQYNSNLVRIGQNESSQYLETNLAPGTPLKVNFVFKDVPVSVTNLASFEVSYYFYLKNGSYTPAKSVTLRDVSIK